MRILVADDHKLVRDGLRPFLKELDSEAEIIDAASLGEAVAAIEGGAPRPDLVLLDLMMPGMTGLDGLAQIKALAPGIPVVIVSGYSSRDHVQAAVKAGAAGFIPKTVGGNAMVNALRLVLSGETYLPSSSFFETTEPVPAPHPTGAPPPFDRLSRREGEILAQLIEGRTNKEIAQALSLQEITIKVHLRNVYRKIGAANRAQAVRIALQSGWDIPPIAAPLPRPAG